MAKTVTNLVSEAKRNKFSQIHSLSHEGKVFHARNTCHKLRAIILQMSSVFLMLFLSTFNSSFRLGR